MSVYGSLLPALTVSSDTFSAYCLSMPWQTRRRACTLIRPCQPHRNAVANRFTFSQTLQIMTAPSRSIRLRYANITGFKSLYNTRVLFSHPLTMLVGPNGSGKSTFLQALDFVHFFASGQPDRFFTERRWQTADVRTANQVRTIRIYLGFLPDETTEDPIYWQFAWNTVDGETISESIGIFDKDNNFEKTELLRYRRRSRSIVRLEDELTKGVKLPGSALALIDVDEYSVFRNLYMWARSILSLELLDPRAMRIGTRGIHHDIGRRGEHLASFLDSLDSKKYKRVLARLQHYYPPAKSLSTIRKRAGWVDARLDEKYELTPRIPFSHVSDGFLRLLAFACIPEFSPQISLVLLDEIEDGVDPHIVSRMVEEYKSYKLQCIITSHSPVFINYFDTDEVVFIARTDAGTTIAASLEELKNAKPHLKFQGPGEFWINTAGNKIVDWVNQLYREKEGDPAEILRKTLGWDE